MAILRIYTAIGYPAKFRDVPRKNKHLRMNMATEWFYSSWNRVNLAAGMAICNVLLNHSIDHAQYQLILLRMVPPFSNVPIWGQNGTDFACCTAKTLRDFRSGLSQCKFVQKRRQVLYQYGIHISQDYQRPNFTYRQLKIFLKTQRYFKKHYYTWTEQVQNEAVCLIL